MKATIRTAVLALVAVLISAARSNAAGYQTVEGTFRYGFAQEVFEEVNIQRTGNGLAPLVMTPELTDVAMKRAAELVVRFSHTRPNGSSCFTAFPSTQNAIGENIAYGQEEPWIVMDGWMNSPGHRANILHADFKSIGVGCFSCVISLGEGYDDEEVLFWAQAFSGDTGTPDKRTGDRDVVVDIGIVAGRDSIVRDYAIAFNANGGTGRAAPLKALYGQSVKLPASPFARTGYLFLGWATEKGGAVRYKNGAAVKNLSTNGGTTTLYAVWAKKAYKVKFVANGGTGKMAVEKFTYGTAKRLSANKFKRTGYTFKGWAKSKALAKKGKVAYRNKKKVKNLVANGKTVKLYAVWKKKK